MNINRHIFLTGFMGSGKSQLGKKTASIINAGFTDLDNLIELGEKKTVADIFRLEGEEAFRKIESNYLRQAIKSAGVNVIALGGGTVCFNDNLQVIKDAGLLVYIELNAAALFDRLKNGQQRPLLKGLSGEAMKHRISELLGKRKYFYEQAHLTVNGLNLTAQDLSRQIIEFRETHSLD